VAAWPGVSTPAGVSFAASGPFGAAVASGALALASGSHLSAPGASAPAALPAGGNVSWSASAWVKCASPVAWAGVLEWGAAGDALGSASPRAAALAVSAVGQDSLLKLAVSTYAGGKASSGWADGSGGTFNSPAGVAADALGSLFVADEGNHLIRKIAPDGVVSTLAGSVGASGPAPGNADGMGTAASFKNPRGIAIDAAGSVFIADSLNHLIRKVAPGGAVSTLAGGGSAGGVASGRADGVGVAATFFEPCGVAIDGLGSVFVADTRNHLIRKVTAGGVVSTLAGGGSVGGNAAGHADGGGFAATFTYPWGVAVDALGSVLVADSGNNLVRKVATGGAVSTLAGGGSAGGTAAGCSDGRGVDATFSAPLGIAVDASGSVVVADLTHIRKIAAGTNAVITLAGGGRAGDQTGYANGMGAAAVFAQPKGIAVNSAGSVFVADSANFVIRVGVPILALPACDATWHHAAVTYASSPPLGTLSAFLDGALLASATELITLPPASSSMLRVGWSGDLSTNGGSLFSGSLAELRIYNRTLSEAELVALSQPLLTAIPNVTSPAAPSAGATSYPFLCAAGFVGMPSTLVKSSFDGSWGWSAGVAPQCVACAAGSTSVAGAAACTPCSPGTFAPAGAPACSLCPAGTFGALAGLTSAACSGACAGCAAGSTATTPGGGGSSLLSCAVADARTVPASMGLQLWPAAHPQNPQRVNLIVAPLATCQQLTSAAACAAAAAVSGADGVVRYVVGTAAAYNMEPAETVECGGS
jgi:hypothetical protein